MRPRLNRSGSEGSRGWFVDGKNMNNQKRRLCSKSKERRPKRGALLDLEADGQPTRRNLDG
jgi:membrane carboxypeptidase/penicillin-binding protein PbpC